ncbi:MAG: hypothetical protein J6J17_04270 [Bacilli bacterium]|nr:hypothetical protein [Bacilli bacterium]
MKDYKRIVCGLKKIKYNIYRPFNDATKVIFYKDNIPKIKLYEIKSDIPLRHQDILGTLYSLNISSEMFGDVIVDNDKYYIIILNLIDNYINQNLNMIKNSNIKLEPRSINILKNYEQKYEEYEIIASSLRIDTVVARITNINRQKIIDKIKNKEIIINYEVLTKSSYILKEGDIFSIKKYGKYKFIGVTKQTKKNNYVIKYLKYI